MKENLDKEKKEVARTQFTIKTEGLNQMEIRVRGCRAGIIYKLAIAISQICKEGAIEIDDFETIAELATDMMKVPAATKKEAPEDITVAELKGKAAQDLYAIIQDIQKGKKDPKEIEKFFENKKKRGKWF